MYGTVHVVLPGFASRSSYARSGVERIVGAYQYTYTYMYVHEIQDTLPGTHNHYMYSYRYEYIISVKLTIHLGSYTCIPGTPTGTAEPGHHQRRQTLPGFLCARCGAAVVILGRTDRTKSAARSVSVTWRSRLAGKCASC